MEWKITFCLFVILISAVFCSNENDESDDPFVPTHEWQVVPKGKKIPKGLHIRVNFETGITEAKLLDETKEVEKKNAVSVVRENAGDLNAEPEDNLDISRLKRALKDIPNDYDVKSEEVLKRIDKFKTYEELKKDLDESHLFPKADTEMLQALLEKHAELVTKDVDDDDVDTLMLVIENLEYLVHQYDNANDFVTLNGFTNVIYKNLNLTNREVKRETLKLLGSCMQNNIKVKIYALETGTLDVLLRLLALEDDLSLKHRALFALSGLLRDFPHAQLKFVENAGVSVFSKLLEIKNVKIRLRTVTLINDLLQEEFQSRRNTDDRDYALKVLQYNNIKLRELLIEQDYCENLCSLLITGVAIDINDHDVIEKCMNALITVVDDCAVIYSKNLRDILAKLRTFYEKLRDEQSHSSKDTIDDFEYFNMLFNLTDKLVKRLSVNVKTEL